MSQEQRVNILLVDDEASNLMALEATLEVLGHNLVKASSGAEALRQILEQDFALILMDVQMIGMNGLETAAAIREREKSRHIPIIFLTGMARTDEIMFKGYSAGAVDFLMKPVRANILRAKVEVFTELALARLRLQEEVAERTRIGAEISKLNAELEQKNGELRETISELECYSYSISHDLRAPLRAIEGYSEILLEESLEGLSDEHQGFLKRISSCAHRMDMLIRDVLSYSQLSRSQIALQPVQLAPLIQDVIDQYPDMLSPHAEIQVQGTLPAVMGNEATLTQCIANFLGNAIKFVVPGVTPKVVIRAEKANGDTIIWFEDNGIGIAPADLNRIFGIFVRIHAQEDYAGTGIGLSIVQKAAERMGGKVGVESEIGKGSRFWLRLGTAL